MRIEEEIKLDYKDVLIRPKRSTLTSRKEVDLVRHFVFKHSKEGLEVVPVIAANMDGVGTFEMAEALASHKAMTAIHKWYKQAEIKKFFEKIGPEKSKYVFYTIGMNDDLDKLIEVDKSLKKGRIHNICIDVANGYTEKFANYVSKVRKAFPDRVIMAGNVVTGEMTEELILTGADIVKVGIGPGSVCTTRKMAGVGYPQLSAVIECADAAHGLGGHICADGGLQASGDVAKALGAGADFVMSGSLFTGHKESGLKVVTKGGKKYLPYMGSSSNEAMEKYMGGTPAYRANEGKATLVPYRGAVDTAMQDILGGLRSACTYVGAKKLKELPKRTTFIRVNRQLNDLWNSNLD
jgi:GMP reductase